MSLLLDDKPKRMTREEALAETPQALQAEMRAVLESPDLMQWLLDAFPLVGIAGEQLLALTVYLVGTSRLLPKPLAAIVQGPSASGKSYVIEQVGRMFPPEAVLFATDLTANALYYAADDELTHRFLVAGERTRRQNDDTAQVTKALRELLATGELNKLVTISDVDGPRTEHIHKSGPIAYVESTTAAELFEEDANRCLILQPDDRPEQTRRIMQARALQYAGQTTKAQRARVREQSHALQRLLEPLEVVIPFSDPLVAALPDEPLEMRRAIEFVGSTIETSALLHQFQRERDELGRIIAEPADYALTRHLLGDVLARCLGGKPAAGLRRFVDRLKKLPGDFTAKEIAKSLTMSERTVREFLSTLLGSGLIDQTQPARGPIPAKWLIKGDIKLPDGSSNPLPPVAAVCGVEESDLILPAMPADEPAANSTDVPF